MLGTAPPATGGRGRRSRGLTAFAAMLGTTLTAALVAPAAAVAAPIAAPTAAAPVGGVLIPAEQVSIGMYSLVPWIDEVGIEPVLDRLETIGFQNIEPYGGWAPGTFEGYTAEEFRALADGHGFALQTSHYNTAEDTFDETLDFVSILGQNWVGGSGFPPPGLETYEDVLESAAAMNRLGQRSVEAGVGKFFGHNHDGEFANTFEHNGEQLTAWEILVEETNPDWVTFQVDIAWAAHAGVDVVQLLQQYGDRIELLHIKDGTGIGGTENPTFTNLGDGEMPLQEILRAAQAAGVDLYTLEYDLAPNGDDFVTTGFEYLTQPAAPVEPVHVPVEQVSIGMFSLVPWIDESGLDSVLNRLDTIGFQNIEPYGGWAPGTFEGYTAPEFRTYADTYGLSIPTSHYNTAEDTFDETLEFVSALGQNWVGGSGFPPPGLETYDDVLASAAAMNRLGERSVAAGVGKFFGHNHDGEFANTFEHNGQQLTAWEILVEETNPEWVTFQVDIAWAAHAGVDVVQLLQQYGDRIELLHIKDGTGIGGTENPTFTNLGEGEMPLQEILAAAQAAGVDLYTLEYDLAPNGEDFVTTGFEYLTGLPAGEPAPLEPMHVPAEQVSIGMFSLVPWIDESGLDSVLNRLDTIGFQNIEPYGGWAPGTFEGYTAPEFRTYADTYGLSIPTSHYNTAEDTFDETLEFVSALGQNWVGGSGFPPPGLETYDDVLASAAAMNRLGERSVAAGVGKFFGHNHDGEFANTFEHNGEQLTAWEILVEETNPDWVTFQVDIAWAAHAGVDVVQLLQQYGDRIELLHIKDGTGIGGTENPTFTNLGEGEMPLQEILRAAQVAGVELYTLEYDLAPNGENFAVTGFEYLTGLTAGQPAAPETDDPTTTPPPTTTPVPPTTDKPELSATGVDVNAFTALAVALLILGSAAGLIGRRRRHNV